MRRSGLILVTAVFVSAAHKQPSRKRGVHGVVNSDLEQTLGRAQHTFDNQRTTDVSASKRPSQSIAMLGEFHEYQK